MLSKNQIKFVRSLSLKKNRQAARLFTAEGAKTVTDLLQTFRLRQLYHTASYAGPRPQGVSVMVSDDELQRISSLETAHEVVAIFEMPEEVEPVWHKGELVLALDGLQDAGNLGTIIRLADWFGISQVVCSQGTVDVYNAKVVQSTMGALARVRVAYAALPEWLHRLPKECPVYVTDLKGDDLYVQELRPDGVLVFGNEGNGVSDAVRQLATRRLLLPNYPQGRPTSESLNVAVATAVIVSEFRRRVR